MKIRRVFFNRARGLTIGFMAFLFLAGWANGFAQDAHPKRAPKVAPQRATENFWMSAGGPQGGDVLALVRNSDYVFAGTLGGGVFRSADNGETWTTVNNGLTEPAILSLAGTTGSVLEGGITLAVYSLGLAIPFLLTAIAFTRMTTAFGWVKRHYSAIMATGGVVLIVMGVLVFTGELTRLNIEAQQALEDLGINFFNEV